ncbi:hypothetical protein KSF_065450 [Reticulibacter mediterranei]|uniref:Uncharacterized protein n=1 Tax=Reticulibacter mediterranei TaxID=2778369 RepID=A0A8J3N6U8_9CHLR|nr:hypothetical protein [Reticulibacter mediterranei]GHO96497.1 hypothetical protein KSF_065450 [Reticulibacter mediterranei]
MSTGVSHHYYPLQDNPECPLVCGDSYFRLKIHDAQAFFPAGILKQAKFLLFSSSVESSFSPGHAIQSLHKLTTLKKNIPCRLGVNTNLTGWLPARETDSIRLTLNYTVTQDTPIKTLVDTMEQLKLEAAVSLTRPDIAVAIKVSQIAGHLLSHLLQEGRQTEVFPLILDLNLADLKSGYYVVLGTLTDEIYPNNLEMKRGKLAMQGGHELSRFSYIVIHVQTLKRRGLEAVREEAWGELLQMCKDEVLNVIIRDEDDRREAFLQWLNNLKQVRVMARKERSFLEREVAATIAEAQTIIEQKLLSSTTLQAGGLEDYPDEWQETLGYRTPQELSRAVRDYKDAVELSEHLLQRYELDSNQ